MMKNLDPKNLSLPLNSVNLPATVSGINRNSPSRASIKIVLPPVIPNQVKDVANSSLQNNNVPVNVYSKPQCSNKQLGSFDQPYYDANNYYNIKPSMQQIPEQSSISMFVGDSNASEVERISPGSFDLFKFNRYSSASLDSGRGSDSIKFPSSQSNRISVHSCESIGSTSSTKDSESSQQSSSLSSSSSTSSSFCSSSSSSSSSSCHPNQYSNRTLSSSSSIVSNDITSVGDHAANNNVFMTNKGNTYANMIPNPTIRCSVPTTSQVSGNFQNLVAQAGPPSIAEMILHGISDPEIIHNWLQKIQMAKYEKNFTEAAYDMSTISRMTPQDLIAIGITDPKSRMIFTAEIQKLHFPDSIPQFRPDSLEEWLNLLNLQCYYASLCQQGYSTIDRVTELTWEDLEDVGINKLGHQKKILLAIKKVKSFKSKAPTVTSAPNEIYCSNSTLRCSESYSNNPSEEANAFTSPNLTPNKKLTVAAIHNTYPLPYQDVPIKMYANTKQNSPTQLAPNEPCSIITPNNIVPSALFNGKSQMRTFQQMSDMNRFNYNQVPYPNSVYGVAPNAYSSNNAPLSYRGRSLESLDNTDCNYYNNANYQGFNTNYSNFVTSNPTYQISNGDSINRQTVFYDANSSSNTFINQFGNQNYEIGGTATLNRPKNLIKNKPIAKIVGSSRQTDYDNYETASIKSNESYDKMSQNSDCNSETNSIYSTLKKKPPPPPKRVNSIRMPNSVPSTPLHQPDQSQGVFSDQVYSNLIYLNTNCNSDDIAFNSIANEDVFASCVKNLTSKFAEMQSLASSGDGICNLKANSSNINNVRTHTLPMNKKELNQIENSSEIVNVSSSSSTESMPFANDNVGTIRQKASNFLQNALKLSDTNSKLSSSSSSSASSPLFSHSVPNSALNSPLSSAVSSNCHSNYPVQSSNDNYQNYVMNDSRQNVVDSLEDIEIMLANLKTQLDSIE